MKQILSALFLMMFLSACGNGGDEEESHYFSATSDYWQADMTVIEYHPPEENAEIDLQFTQLSQTEIGRYALI